VTGKLVTFEGVDGSGKSTQIKKVFDYLKEKGVKVKLVREVGGTDLGVHLRTYLKDMKNRPMSPWVELALIEADRAVLYHEKIIPYLDDGWIVLCDRGPFGSLVYQGYGRGLSRNIINNMTKGVMQHVVPDLAIVYYLMVNEAIERLEKRGGRDDDPFECDNTFLDNVCEGFKEVAANTDYAQMLSAKGDIESIFNDTMGLIKPLLNL